METFQNQAAKAIVNSYRRQLDLATALCRARHHDLGNVVRRGRAGPAGHRTGSVIGR